jgi:hypothetical protein
MKKLLGLTFVAVFMMSMTKPTTEVKETCWEHASYIADYYYNNDILTWNQSADMFEAIMAGCVD